MSGVRGGDRAQWQTIQRVILPYALPGILTGIIARIILPGKQVGGWFVAILLGLLGAMVGGWIAGLFGLDVYTTFWNFSGWVFALIGSIVVLLLFGLIFGRKRS